MIDNTCMGEEFTVTADDFSQDILKEAYGMCSKIKGLKRKRIKGYKECIFTFSNNQNKEAFLKVLSLNVINSYMIYLLCDYMAGLGIQPDIQEDVMPVFFDNNEAEISYMNLVGNMQIKLYCKSNNSLDIPMFWKFNLSTLKKEWIEFLQISEQEIMDDASKTINRTDKSFISMALAAKEVFQKNMPDAIGHELFKIYDDKDFEQLFVIDGNQEIDISVALPIEVDAILPPDQLMSLSNDRIIELFLLLWEPQKAILYSSIHPKTKLKVQRFYAENQELFKNTELYTTDESIPEDDEETIFRDGNNDGEDDF